MTQPLRATYRLQVRPEFSLTDAAGILPYLSALGISHLFTSPLTRATPSSSHGYDVVDFTQVNPEIGGQAAFEQLAARAAQYPIGLVMDLVPNHMAIHPSNPWWQDVLKYGPTSQFACYFDVDWDPPEAHHSSVIMAPVLGDQYGRVLEAGEIRLVWENETFLVRYGDNIYPVNPSSLAMIFNRATNLVTDDQSAENLLAFFGGAAGRLPEASAADLSSARRRHRDSQVLQDLFARLMRESPVAASAVQTAVEGMNADRDALDGFLNAQNYRLAYWKISARELGYRRFFDINSMIGLRMEDAEVFRDTHALTLSLVQRGLLDGLRIDHPDGLRDPRGYFQRLRQSAPKTWVVVEKILEPGEDLPKTWPVQGTTGYDFLNLVNGLWVDPHGEQPLTDFYARFTGETMPYSDWVHQNKLLAATELLGSDLGWLTELWMQICARHRRYRDTMRGELRAALAETAACLPVYRTYLAVGEQVARSDEAYIQQAITQAKHWRADIDGRLFDFLQDLLLGRPSADGIAPEQSESELMARFQQFSGPVMAKGVEDTTFYGYNRLVSLNEVGGDPAAFGASPEDFHRANQAAQANWPERMVTTATHDTKRGEDVRTRLNVLSEVPQAWIAAVTRWADLVAAYRSTDWPDRNMEYLIYQTLVGAWPITAERLLPYVHKAAREAKRFTSWTNPNADYEAALETFVRGVLADAVFLADLQSFVATIRPVGQINSLAQTLLKMTSPGIPDIYQGSELWDLNLVDPDNRRPVDYGLRQKLLDELSSGLSPEEIQGRAQEGLTKMWVLRQALAVRARYPECFDAASSYTPLRVFAPNAAGSPDEEVELTNSLAVAYLRGDAVLVAVPRLTLRYQVYWPDIELSIPAGTWQNLLTGEMLPAGEVSLDRLWKRFPVALLCRSGE